MEWLLKGIATAVIGFLVAWLLAWASLGSSPVEKRVRWATIILGTIALLLVLFPIVSLIDYFMSPAPGAEQSVSHTPLSAARLIGMASVPLATLIIFLVAVRLDVIRFGRGLAGVIEQDLKVMIDKAPDRIKNEEYCKAFICAASAIQGVVHLLEPAWRQGRHSLSEDDAHERDIGKRSSLVLGVKIKTKIKQYLKDHFDKCTVVSDEDGEENKDVVEGSRFTWILDPIDGGRHLSRNIPLYTTTLTLIDTSNASKPTEPILTIIYSPVTGELFFAVKGCGAHLNNWGDDLRVSTAGRERYPLVHVEFPNRDLKARAESAFSRRCELVKTLITYAYRIRGFGVGSLALAYVAKGAFDGYVTLTGSTLGPDVVGGALLVTEAGGQVEITPDPAGAGGQLVIAANPQLFAELQTISKEAPA
jgi:fructose-1,6-bisphosphatase/inositol monophosphatase family enzyme